jgi:hypothetical protein
MFESEGFTVMGATGAFPVRSPASFLGMLGGG